VALSVDGPDAPGARTDELEAKALPGLSLPGSRALIVGTANYSAASGLPAIEAAVATVHDLGQVLVERCGLPEEGLRVEVDLATPTEMGVALAEEAERAEGVLLFYYVGHGLVNMEGELFLASCVTDARPTYLRHTALAYGSVRSSLLASGARSIVVILDCCFSGRALTALSDPGDESALAAIHGGYVLTAAARDESALAPLGERNTAFSGELIRLLNEGDAQGPESLRLRDAYAYLSHVLPARGFPRPRCQAREGIDGLVLASNPAYQPPEAPSRPLLRPRAGSESELTCPYPGVDAFGPERARYFFGRERLTTELLRRVTTRLHRPAPLVLTGAAGSGKSSLLGAGLLAAVDQGRAPFSSKQAWPCLLFRPGAHPVATLAEHLAPLSGLAPSAVAEQIESDFESVVRLISDAVASRPVSGSDSQARLVMIVDQFEETFTYCTGERERQLFVEMVCALADGTKGRVPSALVLLVVRSQFIGHLTAHPQLASALQDGQLIVRPMSTDDLLKAVVGPAEAAGLTLESGLAETVLQELGADNAADVEPDALSLLSHALLATWHRREGRTLTLDGFEATGGIPGAAVAVAAERAYRSLSPGERAAAERLMVAMIDVHDGTPAKRHRADIDGLCKEAPAPAALTAALNAFTEAGVLTVDGNAAEITDDLLLRAWPRLDSWIEPKRAWLPAYNRIASDAAAWDNSGRDTSVLYRGSRLAAASDQPPESPLRSYLGPLTQEFLNAAATQAEAEAARQRRQTRRLRGLAAALTVMLVIAVTASVIAVKQRALALQERALALQERQIAISGEVTAYAGQVRVGDPQLAAQLAAVAYQIAPTSQAAGAVIESGGTVIATRLPQANITATALSSDGRTIATDNAMGQVQLWDIARPGTAKLEVTLLDQGPVYAMAFSPNGKFLVTAGIGPINVWNYAAKRLIMAVNEAPAAGVLSVAVSPDGRLLVVADSDGIARLYNLITGTLIEVFPEEGAVTDVAFSPDGKTLAIGNETGVIKLWSIINLASRPVATFISRSAVETMAFSPDGRILAAGSLDHTASLWNVTRPSLLSTLVGDTGAIIGVAFSPDGQDLATAGRDRTERLWDISDPGRPSVITAVQSPSPTTAVAVGPDGFVTLHADHTLSVLSTSISQAMKNICASTSVPITRSQWDQYVSEPGYDPPCRTKP
jgi:Caspase domain/WD domain, G-beta repeat